MRIGETARAATALGHFRRTYGRYMAPRSADVEATYARVYTIGTGQLVAEEFVQKLVDNDVTLVVDLRTRRSSRRPWAEEESQGHLSELLAERGIDYCPDFHVSLGVEQGGKTSVAGFKEFARGGIFRSQLTALKGRLVGHVAAERGGAVLLCAESNPRSCHRKVIADVLEAEGWHAVHL